eukprot:TRINITY_DN873_c0_g1_i1.p1 TRINITY_DN873_c0_g1~~TRINITY_DN873_c0_g1_i1.p1  ORF type:complete len:354 (+),score=128.09 TRINITY_DN873_c0_g1_i1:124-1185(+)
MRVLLCLLLVVFAYGATLRRQNAPLRAKNLGSVRSSREFGKDLVEMIELQLQSGGTYDDVVGLLEQIKKDFEDEQRSDSTNYLLEKDSLETTITENNDKAKVAITEKNDALNELKKLDTRITSLEDTIALTEQQQKDLAAQRADLEERKRQDDAEFERRAGEQNQVLEVVVALSGDLSNKFLNPKSLVEKQEILTRLHTIGATSALAALMELSSTLDQDVLKRVLIKLETIEGAVREALAADAEAKEKNDQLYESIIAKMQAIEDGLITLLTNSRAELSKSKNQVVVETTRKDTNEQIFIAANKAVEVASTTLQTSTTAFTQRTQERNASIEVVQKALTILRERETELKENTQ